METLESERMLGRVDETGRRRGRFSGGRRWSVGNSCAAPGTWALGLDDGSAGNGWLESEWFRQWEELAYGSLGKA